MAYGPDDTIQRDIEDAPYVQLAGILRARLRRGDWKENRLMASENQLSEEFGLSRPTVRRAIALLVDEGRLRVVPRRGTFVAGPASPEGDQSSEPA
ncbi:GntR family transcriptional regulator [Streptomyces sp. NBC_00474]|uniref:GntR family transcriptional regulator n=1 Tax=Streptomyces sp. NBC_00474 TaxID=2975754 RepID=UPI00224E4957|nr:GntR family transcriptional regulator [Streptomyces sp. NBC_00474]MCX5050971.1 GntR family transcriptional regulator [Streptomyces sp. NBC_00474]